MAWIESHTNLEKHHKLIRFQAAMRWSRNEAVGFLHRFWWSVMEVSPSGDVTSLTSPEVMAETLNMKLDVVQDAILKLEEVGFLERAGDRLLVKNWLDYAGRYLSTSLYRRDKKEMHKVEILHGVRRKSVVRQSSDSRRTDDRILPTLPNQPNLKDTAPPKIGAAAPPQGNTYEPKTPLQQVVSAFKLSMGVTLEDRAWDQVYYPRFSKPAKELLILFANDVDRCIDCIEAVADAHKKRALSWKPETIVKHASDWKEGRLFK